MKKILLIALLSTTYSFSQCFVKIASGEQHTIAIADDGTLWGWGSNTSGELGLGNTTNVSTPTQIGTDNNWVDISCGAYHSMALKSNNTFYTWGYNNKGQCGNGTTTNVLTPFSPGTANKIDAGGYTSFIIETGGQLSACGENANGQYGDGQNSNFIAFGRVSNDTDWLEIETSYFHSLAIKGTQQLLYTTGNNQFGSLGSNNTTSSNTWTNYVAGAYEKLGAGTNYSMALTSTGALHVFGRNNYGQLGNGDNTFQLDVLVPTAFASTQSATGNIQDFSCGPDNVIVLNTVGSVYSWGRSQYNLSGLSMATHNWSPYYWNVTWGTPTAVGMGLYMASVCTDEGTWTWGKNDRGQLGDGSTTNNTTPSANSANCSSDCNITNVSIDNVSVCDPLTNSYTVTLTTTYDNPGDADEIVIGGFGMPNAVFTLTGSPQTETVTIDFDDATTSATNLSVSLTSSTNVNFSCIHPVINNAWTAPASCSTAGIDDLSAQISIYPNPAGDQLNILMSEVNSIVITDINGKHLLTSESSNTHQLNVTNLVSGIYFIQTENGSTHKFIKK